MAEVVLDRVSRVYAGGLLAVDSIRLTVHDGEFLVLVGPSGCGKSTTLRMIAGLEDVSSGEIRIGRRVVNHVPPRDRDIAMVFQNFALYPHLTVRANLAFGLKLRYGGGLAARVARRVFRPSAAAQLEAKRRGIDAQVRSVAQTLGIEPLLDRMPGQLSGGECQRVALGRALVRRPAVFLLDEPLSNLDAKLRVEVRRELKQLQRQLAATMIYVTHDQVEAVTLGDRVAVMERGAIQQVGSVQEVYDRPNNRFVAGFIGSPPMNFVAGELSQAGGPLMFQAQGMTARVPDRLAARFHALGLKSLTLGVRAEDVWLDRPEASSAAGRVVHVESLGDACLVHVELAGGAVLVGKTEARTAWVCGEGVQVGWNEERIHWFDGRSGENIGLETPVN